MADRDIEQAADAATPPASRDDTAIPWAIKEGEVIRVEASGSIPAAHATLTVHDPFKIEEAAKALWELHNSTSYWTWANEPNLVRQRYRRDALAAVAVIVPATAERIAVEFENWSETATWLTSDTCRAVANMIRSLDFGAGLSAGATTGEDGDE